MTMDNVERTVNFDTMNDYFLRLGFRDNIMGTEMLRYAVQVWRPCMSITRGLYPMIAKKFNSTPQRVERAMRHAIETAFTRGESYLTKVIFKSTISADKGKPTNSEFIARMARALESAN